MTLPPLSLYIHYPWCVKKCPYCDFNSHESENRSGYIEALLKDLDDDLIYIQGRNINSIFIGGGTPSLMSIEDLDRLFKGLRQKLDFANNIEITLETNPGTFEVEKFKAYKDIGINRLSIGVQSFNDKNLQSLGRIHNSQEASKACTEAAKIFDNFNIDLMYGLEGQTQKDCLNDIHTAMNLNPSHISFYQLTVEPNTLFAKFPPKLPEDEYIWEMGNKGIGLLEESGFERYEVSAFGKKPSIHNLNYWEFGDYIGIGAGAHGKITDIKTSSIFRTTKVKSPTDYVQKIGKKTSVIDNIAFDFMLNALRLKNGFDTGLFEKRTGLQLAKIDRQLTKAKDLELLDINNGCIKPTAKGFDFLNDLQELFL